MLGQPALAAVHTYDGSFIECFEAVVPEALRAFGPDLIFSQNGCDAHALDPLGDLRMTTQVYEHVPRRIHDLAHELCEGHWVAVGGGGYDIWRVVLGRGRLSGPSSPTKSCPTKCPRTC